MGGEKEDKRIYQHPWQVWRAPSMLQGQQGLELYLLQAGRENKHSMKMLMWIIATQKHLHTEQQISPEHFLTNDRYNEET